MAEDESVECTLKRSPKSKFFSNRTICSEVYGLSFLKCTNVRCKCQSCTIMFSVLKIIRYLIYVSSCFIFGFPFLSFPYKSRYTFYFFRDSNIKYLNPNVYKCSRTLLALHVTWSNICVMTHPNPRVT